MPSFVIAPIDQSPASDAALESLLTGVYVGGGFTAADTAREMFNPVNVRARGDVLVARDAGGTIVGSVVVVTPESPARRFAQAGEVEMHLLAVRADHRGSGVGSALVEAALERARTAGARRMILWTQPAMQTAQRLYARHGFERLPAMDFTKGERSFLVFARQIPAQP
jgi:GNAT superfamily N-acetyltransferase